MNQAKLLAVAIRSQSRAPMDELESATISVESGVEGDFRGKPGPRQVSVLSQEDWSAACSELGHELPWTARRANLLVTGLTFAQSADSTIRIGDVELKVTGETAPCSRMEETSPGLQQALTPDWRGGVLCRVVTGGTVAPGAEVSLEPARRRED